MKTVALFDIADQSFTFFTDAEWERQIEEWADELENDGYEVDRTDVEEIISLTSGDEYFWDNIA